MTGKVGHGPPWIRVEHWDSLVNYWDTDKWKNNAKIAKENRIAQGHDGEMKKHTAGSVSFVTTKKRLWKNNAKIAKENRIAQGHDGEMKKHTAGSVSFVTTKKRLALLLCGLVKQPILACPFFSSCKRPLLLGPEAKTNANPLSEILLLVLELFEATENGVMSLPSCSHPATPASVSATRRIVRHRTQHTCEPIIDAMVRSTKQRLSQQNKQACGPLYSQKMGGGGVQSQQAEAMYEQYVKAKVFVWWDIEKCQVERMILGVVVDFGF
ncbi:putative transposase [Forsythia ovata]|uniref:Transposase n=1 Tax=Forsythia ovata TaxID=205694 RepID=A0ABD1VKT6_9LAMI